MLRFLYLGALLAVLFFMAYVIERTTAKISVASTAWERYRDRVLRYLKIVGIILAVGQLVSFSLFIVEEALQTIMFSSWAAPKGSLLRESIGLVYRTTLDLGWFLLYSLGWLNPLAFLSYHAYFTAAETWYVNSILLWTSP